MTGGWFIGDFKPSVLRTKKFEVGIKRHCKGDKWPAHKQLKATEYNYLAYGDLHIGKEYLQEGDIFVIPPGEVVEPVFDSNCVVVVVKVPSLPKDKVEVPYEHSDTHRGQGCPLPASRVPGAKAAPGSGRKEAH
jgi:hypothetical protein